MVSLPCQLLPILIANQAAADINCMAVALTECAAAFVSFQWHQPDFPQHKYVNSAALSLLTAGQFGGNSAIYATFAAIYAISEDSLSNEFHNLFEVRMTKIEQHYLP